MSRKALIVVDYQNDFVDGALGFEGAETLEPIICEKIDRYLQDDGDIIFTLDTHQNDYLETREGRNLPVEHCIESSKGWELYGKLGSYVTAETPTFVKNTFGSLELACYLRERNYDTVELCGLVSNICVISNAVLAKAALPEAEIIVDATATASFSRELNDKELDVMEGLHITIPTNQKD